MSYTGTIEAVARSLEHFHDLFACEQGEKKTASDFQGVSGFVSISTAISVQDIHRRKEKKNLATMHSLDRQHGIHIMQMARAKAIKLPHL
jgi:hypothetical protein